MEPESTPPRRRGVDELRSVGQALLWLPFPLSALPLGSWAWLIWRLSSYEEVDVGPLVPRLPLIGNLAHAFEFGILALFGVLLLPRRAGRPILSRTTLAPLACGLVLYAFLDEWHQSRVPERNASLLDLLTDVVGIASTLAVIAYLERASASPAGLARRLISGVVACVAAAGLATLYQERFGPGPWPFGGSP